MSENLPRIVALLAAAALSWAAAAGARPGAYELLESVRRAYGELETYEDLGEIRVRAAGVPDRTFWFATRVAGGDFRWDVWRTGGPATEQRVVWREGGRALAYDSRLRQLKPLRSLAAEILRDFGEGGYEALAVPVFLAGGRDAFADPEAAAVDGPEACDGGECWVLSLSRMGGSIASRWWVDRETWRISRLDVELEPPAAARVTRIRVSHQVQPSAGIPAADRPIFEPPAGSEEVAEWREAGAPAIRAGGAEPATGGGEPAELPEVGFFDEITVSSFTVAVRIVDRAGRPILGLGPRDLAASAAGSPLRVAAVEWMGPRESGAPGPAPGAASSGPAPAGKDAAGKLVVLYLQTEFEPVVARGQLELLPHLEKLILGLPPEDRLAVVSFYGHFKLWQDETRDRDAVVRILKKAVRPGARPLLRRGAEGPLARSFDFAGARRAVSPETALRLLGEAMTPLPGEKVVLYVGWYVGRFRMGEGVAMGADYVPALHALDAARASVFVLDVTDADSHGLEDGLRLIARDTGGTYAKTSRFPAQAVRRLGGALSGHYAVTLERAGISDAHGRLTLELPGRRGEVIMKPLMLARENDPG